MKSTMLILSILFAVSGAAQAAGHECHCSHPPPPLPPMPAMPPSPAELPAPPAPPPLPAVPAAAHAACVGKSEGARLTLTLGKRVTITGVCEKQGESMVFDLREYRRG